MKSDSKGLLKLPTDKALVEDPKFHRYVALYAKVVWLMLIHKKNIVYVWDFKRRSHDYTIHLYTIGNYHVTYHSSH